MARVAVHAASEKLASEIVVLDVSEHLPLADIFVVCTANNDKQSAAILDNVEDSLRAAGHKPAHREGKPSDDWALIAYPEIVVHVQTPQARQYYRLPSLWSDCPVIEMPVLAGGLT